MTIYMQGYIKCVKAVVNIAFVNYDYMEGNIWNVLS